MLVSVPAEAVKPAASRRNVRTITVAEVLSTGNQPERTCIGCRKKGPRSQLLRLVAEGSGSTAVLVDERRRMAGRGAWLHPSTSCLALAIKRRAFGRALPGATETAAVEHWITPGTNVDAATVAATPTVQPESGSEI
ncbi:YlxR family protein [Pseudarthrobacter defluvii]|uniref:YlxR family protein n=1 Tax=Pseudarthrobacter defluvii TaxID=410837 RepID=UPI0027D79E87|nr:YlxR family protein [Pseudarthrobacter defluvii]